MPAVVQRPGAGSPFGVVVERETNYRVIVPRISRFENFSAWRQTRARMVACAIAGGIQYWGYTVPL